MDDRRAHMDVNLAHWNELVPINRDSAFYDLEAFLRGRNSVDDVSMGLLGDVDGRRLLHLQCHFGKDTLSLAREGALVTGVDFSPPAIETARQLAREIGVDALFIEANIYDLPDLHEEQYELVFTSHGTITWLPDIEGWARVVSRFLQPGGKFVFLDAHPIAWPLKQEDVTAIEFEFDYFNADRTFAFSSDVSYAGDASSPRLQHRDMRNWPHQLDEILNALIGAGLRIEQVREYPQIAWRLLPFMEQGDDGWWRLPEAFPQLPLMLSIVARQDATSP